MIRVEHFCTRCNGSAQRRDPGDEVSTGYHAITYHSTREAKRDAALQPPKWAVDAQGLLVCPVCVGKADATPDGSPAARHSPASDARVIPSDSRVDGWPAREAPFGA